MKQLIRNFVKHDCYYHATHIAFCTLLSIVPLILITVSIVGFLLGSSQEVFTQLVRGVTDLIPQGKEILLANLNQVVGSRHSVGVIGLVVLLFSATILFGALERALDAVFETTRKRNFFHSRLVAIGLIGMISFFFFLPTVADLMSRGLHTIGMNLPIGDILRGKFFFTLFALSAFVMVVKVIPNRVVGFRYAVAGGLVFSVAIAVVRKLFHLYLAYSFQHYNVIYGSLTALVMLLLWIFYVSNILLFSAETTAWLQVLRESRSRKTGA